MPGLFPTVGGVLDGSVMFTTHHHLERK